MARLIGPLWSLDASGAIGKSIQFDHFKGRVYARRYAPPGGEPSPAQRQARNAFGFVSSLWKQSGAVMDPFWRDAVPGRIMTTQNFWIGENYTALRLEPDVRQWVGSPGQPGANPPTFFVAQAGPSKFRLLIAALDRPPGWTPLTGFCAALETQNPANGGEFTIKSSSALLPARRWEISGLKPLTEYTVAGWLQWENPDAELVFGPSINSTQTTT